MQKKAVYINEAAYANIDISNYANNRVLTSDGTDGGIVAESNMTFDGTDLFLTSMSSATQTNAVYYDTTTGKLTYGSASAGSVTEVSSTTTNQLTVADGTSTPQLTIVTGAVANGGTALATGDQIYDFVTGQGYGTGTVTQVDGTGTVNGLTLSGSVTSSGSLTLGGTLSISNDDWNGTDLSVANGGTGLSNVPANYILTGNGTSALTAESSLQFDGSILSLTSAYITLTSIPTPTTPSSGGALYVGGYDGTSYHIYFLDNAGRSTQLSGVRSVDKGGTGLSTVGTDNLLTGNGTSALTSETGMTYNGTLLTVDSAIKIVDGSDKYMYVDGANTIVTVGDIDQAHSGNYLALDVLNGDLNYYGSSALGVTFKVTQAGNTTIDGTLKVGGLSSGTASDVVYYDSGTTEMKYGTISVDDSNWSGTVLSVAHGGTGLSTVGANYLLTGNGTSALTAESNLTFDGSALTVNGTLEVVTSGDPYLQIDPDNDITRMGDYNEVSAGNYIAVDSSSSFFKYYGSSATEKFAVYESYAKSVSTFEANAGFRSMGSGIRASGKGLEVKYDSTNDHGYIFPYDRDNTQFIGDLDIRGTTVYIKSASTTSTYKGISVTTSGVIVNDDSNDLDFRVETNNEQYTIYADGGTDQIHLGKIGGSASISGRLVGGVATVGSTYSWSTTPGTSADNIFLYNYSRTSGDNVLGGTISFSGPSHGSYPTYNSYRHAVIGGIQETTETDYVGITFWTHNSTTTTSAIQESMRLSHDGNLYVKNDVVAYSTVPSDIRLKENITDLEEPLSKVLRLRGIEYNLKDTDKQGRQVGLIAQEVEPVIPELVKERPLPLKTGNTTELYKMVKYEELTPYLVEAIKEQQVTIEELKREIDELKKNI